MPRHFELQLYHMEVLGAGTTVISLLQTAWQVIEYVKAVRSAGDAQQKVLVELIRARTLFSSLNDIAENFKNDEWSRALESLGGPHGVLSEFKALLEWIMDEMGVPGPQQQGLGLSIPTPGASGHREKTRSMFGSRLSLRMRSAQNLKPNDPDNSHNQTSTAGSPNLTKAVLWPFKEAEVQRLLGKLERIKTHLLLALSSDNIRLSRLIRDELQSVHGEIGNIREHQEGSKAWTTQQELIFRSISSTDFSSHRFPDNIAELKESASVLLRHQSLAEWLADDTNTMSLLLSGGAGRGKTSMCRVVENYIETLSSNSDTLVVAVYFSHCNQDEAQNLQAVLASIVDTMLRHRPQIHKYYNRLMLTGEGPLQAEDSLRIIHRARQDFQKFYVLIDALDECDTQQAEVVVKKLTQLRNPLKVFATSRMTPLTAHFSAHIRMEQVTQDGIFTYIERSLAEKFPVVPGSTSKDHSAKLAKISHDILGKSQGRYVLRLEAHCC